ncbi:hypothetical protein OCB03_22930 [Bacillus cereus]|nr:hypothetical protein [Bacillus cereus]
MNSEAVIICISGRGGVSSPSGITHLRDRVRDTLIPLGANVDNIFRRSWNRNQDDNPFGIPWIEDLNREINQRTTNPSYLAIIGHSYGGWAACLLSRETNRVPDFIGLIDPVFGPRNSMESIAPPRGNLIKNWFQNNSIINGEPCTGIGRIPCSSTSAGLSCGYTDIPGADNIQEEFEKDWDGNRRKLSCIGGRKHILTSHVGIDDSDWIHRQICDQLFNDLNR